MKKQLTKDQKASIVMTVRDAMFQQIADSEETITDEVYDEAEKSMDEDIDPKNKAVRATIKKEISSIFSRIYKAVI